MVVVVLLVAASGRVAPVALLNAEGRLVGIPIGRMQEDFRFSFILPLRDEMFQKVKWRKRCGAPRSMSPSLILGARVRF